MRTRVDTFRTLWLGTAGGAGADHPRLGVAGSAHPEGARCRRGEEVSFFSALGLAWQIAGDTPGAVIAARAAWATGKGPISALRSFARATEGQVDDEVLAELEAGLRRVLQGLALVVRGAVTLSQALADPRVRQALDQALAGAIEAGFYAGVARATLIRWLEE